MSISRVSLQRPLLLLWALSWLLCVVSLDILHDANDGVLESSAHHSACVVCQFGNQPAQAAIVFQAALSTARTYAEVGFHDTGTAFRSHSSPQAVVPRGPPSPFLIAS